MIDSKTQLFLTKSMLGPLITMLFLITHLQQILRCQELSSRHTVRTLGMEDLMLNSYPDECVRLTRNATRCTVITDTAKDLVKEKSVRQLMIVSLDITVITILQICI